MHWEEEKSEYEDPNLKKEGNAFMSRKAISTSWVAEKTEETWNQIHPANRKKTWIKPEKNKPCVVQ